MSLAHHHFSSLPPAPKASMLIEGLCPWPLNPEVSFVDGLKAPSMPSKPWAPSAYSGARFPPGDGLSHLMGLQLQFLWLVLCQALLPGKPTQLSIPDRWRYSWYPLNFNPWGCARLLQCSLYWPPAQCLLEPSLSLPSTGLINISYSHRQQPALYPCRWLLAPPPSLSCPCFLLFKNQLTFL